MYFPKYWAKGSWTGLGKQGHQVQFFAWGWSEHSVEHAAQEGAKRAHAAAFANGRCDTYLYPNRPLREAILQSLPGAVISRNAYGAEVLNTENIVFVDVDLPEPKSKPGFFASLFGSTQSASTPDQEHLELLREWQRAHRSYTFRVYRTCGGFRYLLINKLELPSDDRLADLFLRTKADPKYVTLCKSQQSFRARLTPKPWRISIEIPSVQFPYADTVQESAMQEWLRRYESSLQPVATCRYIETVGDDRPLAEVEPIIAIHDSRTRADSSLSLA